MEINSHLYKMGERIREVRKRQGLNQIEFYRAVFPEKDLETENIKKKMNQIENGALKRVNIDMILRICEHFDVSLDYLFGFETDYPNYENKAACLYTGLSSEAISQLHFWNGFRDKEIPPRRKGLSAEEEKKYYTELDRIRESKWILEIVNELLEKKSEADEKSGISDLSIFYDLYMMTLDAPSIVSGIDADIAFRDIPYWEKWEHIVKVSSDSISYSDQMGEAHSIRFNEINQQVWRNRLMKDIDDFVEYISNKRKQKIQSTPTKHEEENYPDWLPDA